jgi:hypothetical protein
VFPVLSLRHAASWHATPQRLAAAILAAACGVVLLAFGSRSFPSAAAASVSSNRLSNPSFEAGLAPWGGTRLSRVPLSYAPAGKYVARALAYNRRVNIDDWPGEVRSQTGVTYTGAVSLAAATSSSVGKPINLVVREHYPSGMLVTSHQASTTLTRGFKRLTVSLTAVAIGNYIDVYAYQGGTVASTDGFYADAASLTYPTPTTSAPSPTTSSSSSPVPAPSSATASNSAPAPTPSPSPVPTDTSTASTIGNMALDYGQHTSLGDTSGYRYIFLQDYMYAQIPAIKAANPNTKVLAYLESAVTQNKSCPTGTPPVYSPHDSFGINYCYANASHPEWFLHNSSTGARLAYSNYPSYLGMDIGNTGYQSMWANNAITALKADGFDGVYMDDVNTHPGHGIDGLVGEYSDSAYGQAFVNFVASVAARIRANGLLVAANVSANPWTSYQRTDGLAIAAHLDIYNREQYARWGDICGPWDQRFNGSTVLSFLQYDQSVQAAGAAVTGMDYGSSTPTNDDLATVAYGRAMFFLAWNGASASAYIYRPCGAVAPVSPTSMTDLGKPTGSSNLAGTVYSRSYSKGLVLLNPSATTSAAYTLGATYVTQTGATMTGTQILAPGAALLLRSAYPS